MKTKNKTMRIGFAVLAFSVLATGCTSTIGPWPGPSGGNPWVGRPVVGVPSAQAADTGSVPSGSAGNPASGAGLGIAPMPEKFFPCTRVEESVRVRVDVRGMEYGADLAEREFSALRDTLAKRRFSLDWTADSGKEDVLVALRAARTVYDRFGEFEIHEGDIRATVTVPILDGRLVGDEKFEGRGERALGEAAADRSLADVLVPQVVKWVSETVTPEKIGIAVETYSIAYDSANPEKNQDHAQEFLRRIQSMDGVLEARILSQNDWCGVVQFRFVYLPAKFPGGLINKAVLTDFRLQLTPSVPTPVPAY